MVTTRTAEETRPARETFRPKLTVFHCVNALAGTELPENGDYALKTVKMPCSSMTREVFLLRAFEAGADAVVVLVCPEGACRHVSGNLRAAKRVARVKKLLDEIGLGGGRLNIFNVPGEDSTAVDEILKQTAAGLDALGPNPAL